MEQHETKKSTVNINKSASGSISVRSVIPAEWARQMGLNENEREILQTFDKEKKVIIIKKV